jgi:hypothetical protein
MAKTKTPKNKTKKHGGFIPPPLKKRYLTKKSSLNKSPNSKKSVSPNSKKSVKSSKFKTV